MTAKNTPERLRNETPGSLGTGKSTATPAQATRIDAMLSGGRSTDALINDIDAGIAALDTPAVVVPAGNDVAPATPAETPIRDGYRRITYDVPLTMPAPDPMYDRIFKVVSSDARSFDTYAIELYTHAEALRIQISAARYQTGVPVDEYKNKLETLQAEFDAVISATQALHDASAKLRRARLSIAPYVSEATRKY